MMHHRSENSFTHAHHQKLNIMSTAKKKDYTKYTFQGEQYGKGPLVLAVVRHYLTVNPKTTVKELKTIFPRKQFHSTFEVVESLKKADPIRFFTKNPIHAVGGNVAVTNQWTKNTIAPFIEFVETTLGFPIHQKQRRSLKVAA